MAAPSDATRPDTVFTGANRIPALPPEAIRDYPLRELTKNDVLYRLGDPAETVYRVVEGLVKLSVTVANGKERILAVAGPGEPIGAIAADQPRYLESATGLSPRVRVRVVPRRDAAEILDHELSRATGAQLVRAYQALEDTELPVPARLARALLRLGARFGTSSADGSVRLTLPLTHENFASMVGAARETTTAVLGEMRDEGVISGTRGRYRFERERLHRYANDASA